MNGSKLIVDFLQEKGIKKAFGVQDHKLSILLNGLKSNSIDFISAKKEISAAYMAEAYARITRDIGILFILPNCDVENNYSAILEAYKNDTPLLIISINNDSLDNNLDKVNYKETFNSITKHYENIQYEDDIVPTLNYAIELLYLERSGPVFLEFSLSSFDESEEYDFDNSDHKSTKIKGSEAFINKINLTSDLISKSQYPLIIAGEGIYYGCASHELNDLCKTINIPLVYTTSGKGAISEFETHSLGYLNNFLVQEGNKLNPKIDLIIAIGVKFTQINSVDLNLDINVPLIHIDSDINVINQIYTSKVGFSSNIKDALILINQNISSSYKSNWGNEIQLMKSNLEDSFKTKLANTLNQVLDDWTVKSFISLRSIFFLMNTRI